jgi:hypothetical protein
MAPLFLSTEFIYLTLIGIGAVSVALPTLRDYFSKTSKLKSMWKNHVIVKNCIINLFTYDLF